MRFTPGVSIDQTGTNAISIRGISSSGGAGTTGIYIDDTPIQMRSLGFNPDDTLPKTFDLDRVEVLRGPQGTLFGAGSEGGTVRYILTQPSLTTASTYVRSEVSYTQYGQPSYEPGIAHGGPIIDGTLGLRASVWYRSDGGWIDRVDPTTACDVEHDVNHAGTLVLRLAALWQPVDAFTVHRASSIRTQEARRLDLLAGVLRPRCRAFQHRDPGAHPGPTTILPAGAEARVGPRQEPDHLQHLLLPPRRDHRLPRHGLQPELLPDAGWPTSARGLPRRAASRATARGIPLLDGSGIHLPAGFSNYQTPNTMTNSQQSYTQELRWQSTDAAAKLRWTAGCVLAAREGGQHRGAEGHPDHPILQLSLRHRPDERELLRSLSTRAPPTSTTRPFPPATSTTTPTRPSTARSPASAS